MKARIYKPAKTAMQSGKGNTQQWCLEYHGGNDRFVDDVMGWTGSSDMRRSEVKMYFKTKEEAEHFAKNNNIEYELKQPKEAKLIIKSYSDNFKYKKYEEA